MRSDARIELSLIFFIIVGLSFLSGETDVNAVGQRAFASLLALAESLRIVGFEGKIYIELAANFLETPAAISGKVLIPEGLQQRLQFYQATNNSRADCQVYALEHSPMFEDFDCGNDSDLRIFIGGKPEGYFWAIRRAVRTAAAEAGLPLNQMIGLIMFGLKRPWYHALANEPVLGDLLIESDAEIETKLKSVSHTHVQLKRENTAALKPLRDPRTKVLAAALSSFSSAVKFAVEREFELGSRIKQFIADAI